MHSKSERSRLRPFGAAQSNIPTAGSPQISLPLAPLDPVSLITRHRKKEKGNERGVGGSESLKNVENAPRAEVEETERETKTGCSSGRCGNDLLVHAPQARKLPR